MSRRDLLLELVAIAVILAIAIYIGWSRSTSRSAPDPGARPTRGDVVVRAPTSHPEPSATPSATSLHSRSGIIAWAEPAFGADYLALPIGPGWIVELRGPGGCRVMLSTDAGPNGAMLEQGRVADVAVGAWEDLAGAPRSTGLFRGSWRTLAHLDDGCSSGA